MAVDKASAPPYVKFYFRDFVEGVTTLPAVLRGCHIMLLAYQWNHGSVPGDDPAQLRMIMGVASNGEAKKCWEGVQHKYPQQADGCYRNARLEVERAKVQKFFDAQAVKAETAGRPKKEKAAATEKPGHNPGRNPRVNPGIHRGQSNQNQIPNPEPPLRSGSVPDPKIVSSSSDLSQDVRTETTDPSDAQAIAAEKGWEIWNALKTWVVSRPDCNAVTAGYFDQVYGAAFIRGRLELCVEQHATAQKFMRHYVGLLEEAFAGIGREPLRCCVIVKQRSVARAS